MSPIPLAYLHGILLLYHPLHLVVMVCIKLHQAHGLIGKRNKPDVIGTMCHSLRMHHSHPPTHTHCSDIYPGQRMQEIKITNLGNFAGVNRAVIFQSRDHPRLQMDRHPVALMAPTSHLCLSRKELAFLLHPVFPCSCGDSCLKASSPLPHL